MMTRFQYKSKKSLNDLIDELIDTVLGVGLPHGLLPDYSTLKDMRRAVKKILRANISESKSDLL